MKKIWWCKIGEVPEELVPPGGDLPMRQNVREVYTALTGTKPEFIFSGWGGQLTEPERAFIEGRPVQPKTPHDEDHAAKDREIATLHARLEEVEREKAKAVEAEQVRWQEALHGLDFVKDEDASGNESGDPLDFTADCIRAALAAAREEGRKEEREACAKVADDVAELAAARRTHYRQEGSEVWAGEAHAEASGAQRIAAAIRARDTERT